MNKCKQCCSQFEPKRNTSGKFCSYSCYWTSLRGAPSVSNPKTGEDVFCEVCEKLFYRAKWREGQNKFCSNRCRGLSLKGKHLSPGTEFKKGQEGVTKGMKLPQITGERNYNWRGDEVSYDGLHAWVHRQRGNPVECSHCGKKAGKYANGNCTIQWANISHQYKRDLDDFFGLCVSCHKKYDMAYSRV